ncbi:MAG: hypothetical protein GX640_23670, partial [Fibrobacter sp.]|nr:hypothetical protein [Fibrobacter sp.]
MKRNVIISVSIAAIITALIFLFPKNGVTTDTLSEILEKTYSQLKNDHLLHDSSSISPISALLDSTCLKLSLSLGERTRSPEAVDSLISQIYHKWQIGFNSDDFDLTGMFPQSVIQSQKGSCLGVSLLFLTMAEKIGCPLYGVIIPGHVFIRYDDGIQCRNIEPNREGISHPDDYYRERYLSDHSRTKPLNKASAADLVAILNYNIANSYAKQNKTGSAIKYYKKSIATKP